MATIESLAIRQGRAAAAHDTDLAAIVMTLNVATGKPLGDDLPGPVLADYLRSLPHASGLSDQQMTAITDQLEREAARMADLRARVESTVGRFSQIEARAKADREAQAAAVAALEARVASLTPDPATPKVTPES